MKARARQLFEVWLKGWEEGALSAQDGRLTTLDDMGEVYKAALSVARMEAAE